MLTEKEHRTRRTPYFATVAIEVNRWSSGRHPAQPVSQWMERALSDGFHGFELWENHYAHADEAERGRIESLCSEAPAGCILNTYAPFDSAGDRIQWGRKVAVQPPRFAIEVAERLSLRGVKFNVGSDESQRETYLRSVRSWVARLHNETSGTPLRFLCECHGGTILESPVAANTFAEAIDEANIEFIVHPGSVTADELAAWRQTGRVTHLHIQARSQSLASDGALTERISAVWNAARNAASRDYPGVVSYAVEFSHTVKTADENAEIAYRAVVADQKAMTELAARAM